MKTKKLTYALIFVLLCMEASCMGVSTTDVLTITRTPTIILTPLKSPTKTAFPTAFLSPVVVDATSLAETSQGVFSRLLTTNGNCNLPCLWGITPGKSNPDDAISILEPLVPISNSSHLNKKEIIDINPVYIEGDLGIYINLSIFSDLSNNKINKIIFRTQALRKIDDGDYEVVFGTDLYNRLLRTYSLSQILSMRGTPTEIMIRTYSELPTQTWGPFDILLFYPENGVLIHYITPLSPNNSIIVGCPGKANVELFLVPPGNAKVSNDLLSLVSAPQSPEEVFSGYKSIEEVTSISIDEFVEKFQQTSDECIETNASYWEKP